MLWDIGRFSDPTVNAVISSNNIYGRAYEECTSAMFRTTFANNGLDVEVRRAPLSSSKSISVNTPYVLTLKATQASYDYRWKDVIFFGEVELLDTQSGKKLWSFDSSLDREPQHNGKRAYLIVRGLVVDGYVDMKIEEVRDHYNRIPPTRYDSLYNYPKCL